MEIRAASWGPLPGPHQTVPRGELLALVATVEATDQDIVFFTDNEACYINFHHGKIQEPTGSDADLWLRLKKATAQRKGSVTVIWIPSHAEPQD
eukprot:6699734-Pyramimonas_sp.AAC.1